MGKAKTDESQVFTLTEQEYNMLKVMNLALQYNTAGQKIISGFLYYVCNSRFDYVDGVNLQFELDFEKDDRELKVTVIPAV